MANKKTPRPDFVVYGELTWAQAKLIYTHQLLFGSVAVKFLPAKTSRKRARKLKP